MLTGTDAPADLLRSLTAEVALVVGRVERVAADCQALQAHLAGLPDDGARAIHARLLPLLGQRVGPVLEPVFALLEQACEQRPDPWLLLDGMLSARDPALARRALDLAARLAESGRLRPDRAAAASLARHVAADGSPFAEAAQLGRIAALLGGLAPSGPDAGEPLATLLLGDPDAETRRLAARLLDLPGQPAPLALAERLLGREAHAFLRPYLDYTRAGHADLLALVAQPEAFPHTLQTLRQAEGTCGPGLLKEALAALGWPRLNLGLEARPLVAVSLAGGFPLQVTPLEARLLEACPGARRGAESILFVAHGGQPAAGPAPAGEGPDPVARFRAYNLEHAAALAELLDLAPLTRATVERLLARMDRIVDDFVALFSAFSDECALLPGLYGDLKTRILAELEAAAGQPQLSIELTRLVQAFEDPRSAGAVRTLHGLKRYLHQKGLRLGMRLLQSGRGTNRTVDLLLASGARRPTPLRRLSYVDFEPPAGDAGPGAPGPPFPVRLAVEGLARQLLAGQESFPQVSIFCYGNEVHYYLAFKNHPAFLRIDYSPPLQGGMVDLEYWGVSKYELDQHPNTSLDGLRAFFEALDFEARIEQTHVRARYDKERALDLETICEKAAALLRLAPYLMDVDWIVGDLDLPAPARAEVARAWAAFFARWGVLPLAQVLSSDRRGIRLGRERGPTGEKEVLWDGQGPYRDCLAVPLPPETLAGLRHALAPGGPAPAPPAGWEPGQLDLERACLLPLREALARGELLATPAGLARAGPEAFEREDAGAIFAELLENGPGALAAAARVALLVGPLERTLQFRATATLAGREVQQARLALPGLLLGLHVLRDSAGIVRLALFAEGDVLYRRRAAPAEPWVANWSCDAAHLAGLLRRANYLAAGGDPGPEMTAHDVEDLRLRLRRPSRLQRRPPLPGERLVRGTGASPGRAVGRAAFLSPLRPPEELDGAVLVAAAVRPEDNGSIFRSAGVVATGGGILSHAGLIALQFRKPALVIAGDWREEPDGTRSLACRTLAYREELRACHGLELRLFREVHEREHLLREGDLVALDAGQGLLRAFGQEHEALALHEGLQLLAQAGRGLQGAEEPREVLALRGHRLRARHQVERLLARLGDGALARHAVHELLLGEPLAGAVPVAERAACLSLLLDNPQVGSVARECLAETMAGLEERQRDGLARAREAILGAGSLYEVLAARLELRHGQALLEGVAALASACGLERVSLEGRPAGLDAAARLRLEELRRQVLSGLREDAPGERRHQLRRLARLDLVLGGGGEEGAAAARLAGELAARDAAALAAHARRPVLSPGDGGFELAPLIGWKAANLAELERLGCGELVPAWFVVTHEAFQRALDAPLPPAGATLREAVGEILARPGLGHARQSALIRDLWEDLELPPELAREIAAAYARLAPAGEGEPFVAVRSSAREEDTEGAARAGEFDTFLFVRGEAGLLQSVKRAWSGLWTERALHNRAVLGAGAGGVGGGVVVQRMLRSRVAGVLQTVDVAEGNPREMLINAGLGLGEGIVSGTVAPDQVRVDKRGDLQRGPLRFRYVTSEKREQVVFDERAGTGTTRVATLYHQRLRAALEYAELCELVAVASRLEGCYGYPLDLEFAFEGPRLFVLQARPVPAFQAALRETLERHPLGMTERSQP